MKRIEEKHYFKTHEELVDAAKRATERLLTSASKLEDFYFIVPYLRTVCDGVESYYNIKLLEGSLYKDKDGNEDSLLLQDVNMYFTICEANRRADEEGNKTAHTIFQYAKHDVLHLILADIRAQEEHAMTAIGHILYSMWIEYNN